MFTDYYIVCVIDLFHFLNKHSNAVCVSAFECCAVFISDCHRERRSKRAVRDRTEGRDSFDYDLAEMFEGMTIGSKRKKTEPYHQRKKEKESKQKQARFWVLHTS